MDSDIKRDKREREREREREKERESKIYVPFFTTHVLINSIKNTKKAIGKRENKRQRERESVGEEERKRE